MTGGTGAQLAHNLFQATAANLTLTGGAGQATIEHNRLTTGATGIAVTGTGAPGISIRDNVIAVSGTGISLATSGGGEITRCSFPNLEAQRAEYVDGFGLSEREFELIGRELTPGSRRFLVRQGMQGVVCELNLQGGLSTSSR